MIRFLVFSRMEIENLPGWDEPHAFISIRTPKDPELAKLPENDFTIGVLRLSFHDLDVGIWSGEVESACFSEAQAEAVVAFAHAVKAGGAAGILVHCDAGLCRSPAVAAALSRAWGQDDAPFFRNSYPNRRVYRRILEAAESFYAEGPVR